MKVANFRIGESLKINSREVSFSFWPAKKKSTKYSMQPRVFASDPFNVIRTSISQSDASNKRIKEALAYFDQAKDFYQASKYANVENAKPLLIYYSFHNLIKCLLLMRGRYPSISDSHHGLSLKFDTLGNKPTTSKLIGHKSRADSPPNLFEDFYKEYNPEGFEERRIEFSMKDMFSQVLVGHRLWCAAAGKKERFINIPEIEYLHDKSNGLIWAKMNLPKSEYRRLDYTQSDLLYLTFLSDEWRVVKCQELRNGSLMERDSDLISLELIEPISTGRPSEKINFFYLGSLARYRPQKLKHYLDGKFGSFMSEFIENQPDQWLYLMASEFSEQEVAKAAIV